MSTFVPQAIVPQPANRSTVCWLLSMAATLLPLFIAAVVLKVQWARIPVEFPTHWDFDGRPNGWGTRSVLGIYWPLLFGAFLVACSVMIGRFAPRVLPEHEVGGRAVPLLRRILLAVNFLQVFVFTLTSLMPLFSDPSEVVPMLAGGSVLGSVGVVGYCIYLIKVGGTRAGPLPLVTGSAHEPGGGVADVGTGQPQGVKLDRDDPARWRAYGIYSNSTDAALWVPKRFGLGWTLNFARPAAWLILAVIVIVALASIALVRYH